ncbi:unnamed protein product [Linum trigynum]|uniref:Gnk2-homologous domain-containing protein n=1 Tax=Linum trigynum TaxID=586398 RepID=A0AAV2GI67_9ROSI
MPAAVTVTTTVLLAIICTMFCSLPVVSCFNAEPCAGGDSTGRCSLDPLPAPSADRQRLIFDDFSAVVFHAGNITGCYKRGFLSTDGSQVAAAAYFNCDGAPSYDCLDCFGRGFARLEQGCQGRAGGTVLLEKCCVRYETAYYDFCALG